MVTSALALILVSTLLVGLSVWGAVSPPGLVSFVRRAVNEGGMVVAVGVRLLLAVLLWITAPMAHTPLIFRVLAFLALASAILIALIGSERVLRIIDRFASWPATVLRLQCVFGVVFGMFLIWSVSPAILAAS